MVPCRERERDRSSVRRRSLCPRRLHFFFNDTATTEIYPLSLHDALPILIVAAPATVIGLPGVAAGVVSAYRLPVTDRKSTRLNSSHDQISYAVFCLKKKDLSLEPLDQHVAHLAVTVTPDVLHLPKRRAEA